MKSKVPNLPLPSAGQAEVRKKKNFQQNGILKRVEDQYAV